MVQNLDIRLWGGASRDDTKNGCVADYVRAGLHERLFCYLPRE